MRFFSKPNTPLFATVITLSVAASVGTFLLAGCGGGAATTTLTGGSSGGGGAATTTLTGGSSGGGGNGGGGAGNSFAGRSYSAKNLVLAGERTGTLTLQVSSRNVLSGVLNLTNPTDTVTLTGTLNSTTGVFQLNGTLTRDAGGPVTVQGTLPTPPATTGGSLTLTIGGQTITATFSISSASPTPTPTPTSSNPPATGSGTLLEYYNAFTFNANDTFSYQFTNTDTLNPDPNSASSTSVDHGTIHGGILFGAGGAGQKTTVTINLPVSGSKTVTRQEQLNPNTNALIGYTYYTEDASGRTDYGDDSVFNNVVIFSTRYDKGDFTPFSLIPGQSYAQTFTVYETQFNFDGSMSSQNSYVQQERVTFVGIETVTVVGGTYTNTAHLRSEVSYTLPVSITAGNDQPPPRTRTSMSLNMSGLFSARSIVSLRTTKAV